MYKQYVLDATRYQGGESKPEGRDGIIKLSSNENQLGASPMALNAIRRTLSKLSEYPDNDDDRLRRALSNYYQQKLSANQFFCAPAGSEIIELICRAFLEPDQEVIISSPTFIPFRVFSEKMGARVIDVPRVNQDFLWNPEAILAKINSKTRLVFMDSPNNPTGNYISRNQLSYLLDHLPEQVILVYDEVYFHYSDASDYSRALDFLKDRNNIIGVNSFSKVYGLAGLRLGYGYSSETIADYIRCLCKPFLNSILAIEGGLAALLDRQFVEKTIISNAREKQRFYHHFRELGLKHWPTQANFILVKSPVKNLYAQLLDHNIMVRPISLAGDDYFRITIGTSEQNTILFKALKSIWSFFDKKNIPR